MINPRVASMLFAGLLTVPALAQTQPAAPAESSFPTPSLYPISWELDFKFETPARIAVDLPGSGIAKPFWYIIYEVTNNTPSEQSFLPVFEMVTADGNVIRSDQGVPKLVFDRIVARAGRPMLQTAAQIAGPLRVGPEQVKYGVAIWPAPEGRNSLFTIYVGGLSGEAVVIKDAQGKPAMDPEGMPILLRKTLKLDYTTRGDEFYAGDDRVTQTGKSYVMR